MNGFRDEGRSFKEVAGHSGRQHGHVAYIGLREHHTRPWHVACYRAGICGSVWKLQFHAHCSILTASCNILTALLSIAPLPRTLSRHESLSLSLSPPSHTHFRWPCLVCLVSAFNCCVHGCVSMLCGCMCVNAVIKRYLCRECAPLYHGTYQIAAPSREVDSDDCRKGL